MSKKDLSIEDRILLRDSQTFFFSKAWDYIKENKLPKEKQESLISALAELFDKFEKIDNAELIKFLDYVWLTSKVNNNSID